MHWPTRCRFLSQGWHAGLCSVGEHLMRCDPADFSPCINEFAESPGKESVKPFLHAMSVMEPAKGGGQRAHPLPAAANASQRAPSGHADRAHSSGGLH